MFLIFLVATGVLFGRKTAAVVAVLGVAIYALFHL